MTRDIHAYGRVLTREELALAASRGMVLLRHGRVSFPDDPCWVAICKHTSEYSFHSSKKSALHWCNAQSLNKRQRIIQYFEKRTDATNFILQHNETWRNLPLPPN